VILLAAAALAPSLLSVKAAEDVAVVALVVILFNGGRDIGRARMREALAPALSLGILGTFLTAGVVALAAHELLDTTWTMAGLIGAALAPTDPAVVFSVLRGRTLKGRVGTILEAEAGLNDPAGIALMLGMIELATHDDATFAVVIGIFVLQMGLGAVFGALGAYALPRAPGPLIPVVVAAIYLVTTLVGGSGFLAVFLAGLALPPSTTFGRLASLAEITVFIALGLTIDGIAGGTWSDGLILVAVLALVARPLTVALLAPTLPTKEKLFVGWAGLKGAVPILLAAFALVEDAGDIYELTFVVVLVSVLAQGTFVPALAKRLALER
jgi:cell volume regulation protein A